MKFLGNLYQYANILSLDVVTGAVISALFFGRLLHAPVAFTSLLTLGFAVWIIYTLDHLRDAMTIPKIATTDRHRFHQKHFRAMVGVLFVVMMVELIVVWFLPPGTFRMGVTLGLIVLVYLVLQRYLKFLKEFFVACLYTAGVLLPSLPLMHGELTFIHYVIIGKFFITALMNLLLFSLFDYKEDRHQQQHSFVTWFGPGSTRIGILILGSLNILLGFWLWEFDMRVAVVFILMNLALLGVLFAGRKLVVNNYYRIIGDAVFFIPGLYLL